MSRKLSLITAVAVAALSVGAPAAFGEGRLAGSPEPVLAQPDPMIEDGFAQAVKAGLAVESKVATYPDAHERGAATNPAQSSVTGYRDAFERSVAGGRLDLSTFRNAFERGAPLAAPAEVPAVDSGSGIDWSQLGIGFGLGIALALGLMLAVRASRSRPLAHR